jgi:hypothetical protein
MKWMGKLLRKRRGKKSAKRMASTFKELATLDLSATQRSVAREEVSYSKHVQDEEAEWATLTPTTGHRLWQRGSSIFSCVEADDEEEVIVEAEQVQSAPTRAETASKSTAVDPLQSIMGPKIEALDMMTDLEVPTALRPRRSGARTSSSTTLVGFPASQSGCAAGKRQSVAVGKLDVILLQLAIEMHDLELVDEEDQVPPSVGGVGATDEMVTKQTDLHDNEEYVPALELVLGSPQVSMKREVVVTPPSPSEASPASRAHQRLEIEQIQLEQQLPPMAKPRSRGLKRMWKGLKRRLRAWFGRQPRRADLHSMSRRL